jgi:hypothetical protein
MGARFGRLASGDQSSDWYRATKGWFGLNCPRLTILLPLYLSQTNIRLFSFVGQSSQMWAFGRVIRKPDIVHADSEICWSFAFPAASGPTSS